MLQLVLACRRLSLSSSRCILRNRTKATERTNSSTVLFSSASTTCKVDISPTNHGTLPLQSLVDRTTLDTALTRQLQRQKLTKPTPIQAHCIPLLLKGFDVMASAQTGSGKSLMFALPLCQALLRRNKNDNNSKLNRNSKGAPLALILNPTRELAMQTATVLQNLTSDTKLSVALATGGASTSQQLQQMKQGVDILVGTPGRVLQFVDERQLRLDQVQFLTIDEADRMLDLGFEPQLQRIARTLNRNTRQTILCSATFPLEVQRLGSLFLKPDYYFVAAGKVGGMHSNIEQDLNWISDHNGGNNQRRLMVRQRVQDFLQRTPNSQVIVFCNKKDECENLGEVLSKTFSTVVVTGDKSQAERNRSLDRFRRGSASLLVATDVAARGLDVPSVGLVIQATTPRDVDTFVHRVGRTGRAGRTGQAIAFLDRTSLGIAKDLVVLLRDAQQQIPAWLQGMAHVAQAKQAEEEYAIAAGGGSVFSTVGTTSEKTEGYSEAFSGQDFRSGADAGSWGAERDTSYHEFDEEAYSSMEASTILDDLDEDDSKSVESMSIRSTPSSELSQGRDEDDSSGDSISNLTDDQSNNSTEQRSIEKIFLSDELTNALNHITGSAVLSELPRRNVLDALSSRNVDPKIRYEYIGMFPYQAIADMLTSKSQRDSPSNNGLPRILMVAEKPSIAKAVADALSGQRGPRQKRGISRGLAVYEFISDDFVPIKSDPLNTSGSSRAVCIVTSVVGHIFSLAFSQETADDGTRKRLDPSEYFHIPVVKQEEITSGKLRVIDHLRALASTCDHLVLWLDCDAEGENIAFETIGVTRKAFETKVAEDKAMNPTGAPVRRIHRARFSALTNEALRDAFQNLGEPDAALSRSVDARQELDLRVGVSMTRLLTWRCVGVARQRYSPSTKFVSYGPCQSPTLSFCVDRAREIEAFKTQEYYKIHTIAHFADNPRTSIHVQWKPTKDKLEHSSRKKAGYRKRNENDIQYEDSATLDERSAAEVVRRCSQPGSFLQISKVDALTERVSAPLGLNTVALLSAGSKSMGMSPKQVMNVAEKLYSSGYLSYPRTETTKYDPKGFDVRAMLREHSRHPDWGRTATHLLRTKYATSGKPPSRGKDIGDHPPITCLKSATREEIGGGAAWRVYEFVVRNMLGSFSDDLVFTRSVAEVTLLQGTGSDTSDANPSPVFALEEIGVDSLGFASACTWVLKDIGAHKKEEDSRSNVHLSKGMNMMVKDIRLEKCHTKPPSFLQEHELIELMDKNRVGTDASMATHVNNIVDRGYVVLCDETGLELRPPRPPRPGRPPLPRQIGRYLVPTPLGMGLMDLFTPDSSNKDQDSVALLARPAIRAQMEAECQQIAMGEFDKETCLAKNLKWFKDRYHELAISLPTRLDHFAKSLKPTKDSLFYWRKLGAFETATSSSVHERNHGSVGKGGKSNRQFNGKNKKQRHGTAVAIGVERKQQSWSNSSSKRRYQGPAKSSNATTKHELNSLSGGDRQNYTRFRKKR